MSAQVPSPQAAATHPASVPSTQARRSRKSGTGIFARLDDTETRLDELEAKFATATTGTAPVPPVLPPSIAEALIVIAGSLKRIADHFDPAPADIVDSPYVAQRLGCTTTWIADMARQGEIPERCIVLGSGNGKPWKFYRGPIEQWIASR